MTFVVRLDEDECADQDLVGGKALNLGRMTRAGLPVPPGFVVTAAAYQAFVEHGDLSGRLTELLATVRVDDPDALAGRARQARELISNAEMPSECQRAITAAYRDLSAYAGESDAGASAPVAVRSSGTAEDLAGSSFAGQHDTYLDIVGVDDVLDAVRRCFASLWTDRAVAYRQQRGFDHAKVALPVVVQVMRAGYQLKSKVLRPAMVFVGA